MKRRTLVSLLGGAAIAPAVAAAQTRTLRLGLLTPTAPLDPAAPPTKFLLDVLAQRGYRLGDNLAVTTRAARGQTARLAALVQGVKAERIDVPVTSGYPATPAAKDRRIP